MPVSHRQLAKEFFSPEEIAHLRCNDNWRGTLLVLHAWLIIVAMWALFVIFPNPVTFIVAVFVIGGRQLGLSILMHDAAHGALAKNQRLNLFLSQWFCAYPGFVETEAYRRYHLKHHANTQQANDPDLSLSDPFPTTGKSLWRKFFRDLTGQTAFKQRGYLFKMATGEKGWPFRKSLAYFIENMGAQLLANGILFLALALMGLWYIYPLLWLLPLFTVYQLVLRIRNIAEHAMVPDNNDPLRNTRTTHANWLERIFLAPYWVNYHLEHHLLFWVPCYNLPKLHKLMDKRFHGRIREEQPGYWTVLKMAASLPNDKDGTRKTFNRNNYNGLVMLDE